jgi:hypothetical protein
MTHAIPGIRLDIFFTSIWTYEQARDFVYIIDKEECLHEF